MKTTLSPVHLLPLVLAFFVFSAGPGLGQTKEQTKPARQSFSLIYSSNVAGEYEPCG